MTILKNFKGTLLNLTLQENAALAAAYSSGATGTAQHAERPSTATSTTSDTSANFKVEVVEGKTLARSDSLLGDSFRYSLFQQGGPSITEDVGSERQKGVDV